MERSGPIAAAVRSAGYMSEEGEEDEDEDEGSSVEETDGEYQGGEVFQDAPTGDEEGAGPPSYSHPTKEFDYGANGYPVRSFLPSSCHTLLTSFLVVLQIDKKGGNNGAADPTTSGGAGVTRKPSKRQQEKAPEGQAPHVPPTDQDASAAGPAPAESKFTEGL